MSDFILDYLAYNGRQIEPNEFIRLKKADLNHLDYSSLSPELKVVGIVELYDHEISTYFNDIFNQTSAELIVTGCGWGSFSSPGFFTREGESIDLPSPFEVHVDESNPSCFDSIIDELDIEDADINILSVSVAFFVYYFMKKSKGNHSFFKKNIVSKYDFEYCLNNYDTLKAFKRNDYKRINQKLVSSVVTMLSHYVDSGLLEAYSHVVNMIGDLWGISGGIGRFYSDKIGDYIKESKKILVTSCISVNSIDTLLSIAPKTAQIYIVRDVVCSDDVLFGTAKVCAYLSGRGDIFFEDRPIFDNLHYSEIDTVVVPRVVREIKQNLVYEYLIRSFEFLNDNGVMIASIPFYFVASGEAYVQRTNIIKNLPLARVVNEPGSVVDYNEKNSSVLLFKKGNHEDAIKISFGEFGDDRHFRGGVKIFTGSKTFDDINYASFERIDPPDAWIYERLPVVDDKTTMGDLFEITTNDNVFTILSDCSIGGDWVLAIDRLNEDKMKEYKALYTDIDKCTLTKPPSYALLISEKDASVEVIDRHCCVEKGIFTIRCCYNEAKDCNDREEYAEWAYYLIREYMMPRIRRAIKAGIRIDLDYLKKIEVPKYNPGLSGQEYINTDEFHTVAPMVKKYSYRQNNIFTSGFEERDKKTIEESENIGDCSKLIFIFRDLNIIAKLYESCETIVSLLNVDSDNADIGKDGKHKEKVLLLSAALTSDIKQLSDEIRETVESSINLDQGCIDDPGKIESILGNIYLALHNEIYEIVGRRGII